MHDINQMLDALTKDPAFDDGLFGEAMLGAVKEGRIQYRNGYISWEIPEDGITFWDKKCTLAVMREAFYRNVHKLTS